MQPNSIPEPLRPENERLSTFPLAGDNFQTVACVNGASDLLALLEAIALLEDVKVAWQAFEAEKTIQVQDLDAH
jgi:aspartate 1-decarboxylase